MEEVEASTELVDVGLRACSRVAHGLKDELRLGRWS
jgi:hypothetical protein